jgi:hypothetical protein
MLTNSASASCQLSYPLKHVDIPSVILKSLPISNFQQDISRCHLNFNSTLITEISDLIHLISSEMGNIFNPISTLSGPSLDPPSDHPPGFGHILNGEIFSLLILSQISPHLLPSPCPLLQISNIIFKAEVAGHFMPPVPP